MIATRNNYDDHNRLVKVEKKISSTINSVALNVDWKIISEMEYDALGRVRNKKVGTDPNSTTTPKAPLENLVLDYNIRGWILGMNRNYMLPESNAAYKQSYFGFELGYDKSATKTGTTSFLSPLQYNGNITGMVWKSTGDKANRKYDFTYDNANQLLKADFNQAVYQSSTWGKTDADFNTWLGDGSNPTAAYDANGNIKRQSALLNYCLSSKCLTIHVI